MMSIEIIDYTNDYVFYFEDVYEAEEKLEELHSLYPEHEVEVSHFEVFGVEIPFSEANVEFIKGHEESELEAVMTYYEYENGLVPNIDLESLYDDMEKNANITYVIAEREVDAFVTYYDMIGLYDEIPEHLVNYIDWEKLMRDFKFSGIEIYRLSYNHPTRYRYMIVG